MINKLSEAEIDDLVIAQAEDEESWEKPIFVNRQKAFSLTSPISIDKDILGGTPVFKGTRVPVSALIDNIEAGLTLDDFLNNFPTVSKEKAVDVLEYLKRNLSLA